MPNRPTHISYKESYIHKSVKYNPNHIVHHGAPDDRLLLQVPSETLLGITSYLDPPSLFSLARVHPKLNDHVKDDNTWYRAFICQFLGIGPEGDAEDGVRRLMLRRSETTWKKEFVYRFKLIQRWERSRNSSVAHIPVNSEISAIHLMPGYSLLTSSIRYGIVSRSLPFSGKVLTGYIEASGAHFGLGVGNPNAEFSPNVSACALSSDGGTAKVLWGFRHGTLASTTVPRAMDGHRRPPSLIRCYARDEHAGAVLDVNWDNVAGTSAVSAGADGRVKIWDTEMLQCLWTSEWNTQAYVKAKLSPTQGFVVAVTKDGDIVFWTGLVLHPMAAFSSIAIKEVRVRRPFTSLQTPEDSSVLAFEVNPYGFLPAILIAYQGDAVFYRVQIEETGVVAIRTFGDTSFGPISTITPSFSRDSSFVLAGDHLGCVSVYNWSSNLDPIPYVHKFEAHDDMSGVSAIALDGVVLVTGSINGRTNVWDALTFECLRSFPSPIPRPRGGRRDNGQDKGAVGQILLGPEKDAMIVSVGDRVLAWRAGPAPQYGKGGVRGRHTSGSSPRKKKDDHGVAKYHQQVELQETIAESRTLLQQESESFWRATSREKEHREKLDSLGLSETEAVEYILMLSRDEALQEGSSSLDEGDFEHAFSASDSSNTRSTANTTTSTSDHSASLKHGLPTSPVSPTESNEKVQVSPPSRAEPKEAVIDRGFSPSSSQSGSVSDVTSDESHFPLISASSVTSRSPSVRPGSAWSTPLTISRHLSPSASASASPSTSVGGGRANASRLAEEEVDEELRFALELSLAEAKSRGETV